jgi:diguanylate cyclase (GGDEF)-like protein/PAS domain S-box-containing protein
VSLVTRIFVLIAMTLLLVAGGELFNGLKLRQERLGEVRSDTAQLARIAELDIDRILEGAHQLLATLAKLPADQGWDERACSIVEATASSDFEYDHIVGVDRSGIIRCSSNGAEFVGTPMPDRELFNRIVKTTGFSVGSYGIGRVSSNEVVRVGYPVVDGSGAVVGAVYAGINLIWLNTAISQWQLGTTASIEVTDQNGIVIARYPDPQRVGEAIADSLKPFLSAADGGAAEVVGPDGVTRLYGYEPVDAGPSSDVAVFVGRDQAQVFADIDRSIWLNAAAVLTGLTLAGGFAFVYLRRVMARPFQALLTAAGRWSDGDWSARAGAASGIPEFDRLSSAFDLMAAEVSAHIGEREIVERAKLADLDRFRFIFDSVSDGINVMDAKTGRFTDANPASCAMFGYSRDELIGHTIEFLSTGISPYTQRDAIASLARGSGEPQTIEWHCKAKDGHSFWAEISFRNVALEDRAVGLAILRDITERKRGHDEVVRQANIDVLTDLPNRRAFDDMLQQEIARSGRYDRPLCVAIGDIDHFKIVNDTFGHPAGDAVLRKLAEFMRNSLRTTDYVARWGGEEFAILLPETRLDVAVQLLNRLRANIANFAIPEIGRAVTLSFGVTARMQSDDPDDLVERADRALYTSKQTGRDRVTKLRRSAARVHSAPAPL